ncbi:hepatic and glial cell adhesion molecule-like [Heptranchias perlo]|uniref:hepatic and glial cell adhesion molecule-like n=1 Tax=Heptranchias perlo TaxID=212740 RepID=UPI00355A73C7
MDIRTRPSVIICIVLLFTGAGSCLDVKLKEEIIYGIDGQAIHLDATYQVEPSNKLHSITWKVDREGPTRILQYIAGKNKTLPSTPYRSRIQFDSETGSLVLFNFAESDQGSYQVTVTAEDGAETKASTEVTAYERISGVMVSMALNETNSPSNVTLICSVRNGTKPDFFWTKGGKNVTDMSGLVIEESGRRLVLHMISLEDCGSYTCKVSNELNHQIYSLNLSASSNFPQCEVQGITRKRHRYLLPILFFIPAALMMGLLIYLHKMVKSLFSVQIEVTGLRAASGCLHEHIDAAL